VSSVRAFAPGSVANLGPGLDVLALALDGAGDVVTATATGDGGLRLTCPGASQIPSDPALNTAGIAASSVLRRAGAAFSGLALEVQKGLPLSGGQGGSAASAAAAAVAVNALLKEPLPREQLLLACVEAEEAVAGRHADNAAAALYGGVVLVRSIEPPDVVRLSHPAWLRVVLAIPDQRLRTEEARAVLPPSVDRETAVFQAAQVGALVAALASGDRALLARAVEDRLAEPARAPLLPGFASAKRAAVEAGALGCSIAGAGPAMFAFADGDESAQRIARAMAAACSATGWNVEAIVRSIDPRGARLLEAAEAKSRR